MLGVSVKGGTQSVTLLFVDGLVSLFDCQVLLYCYKFTTFL